MSSDSSGSSWRDGAVQDGGQVLAAATFSWPGGRDSAWKSHGPRVVAAVDTVFLGEVPPWAQFDLAESGIEHLRAVPRRPSLVLGMGGSALGTRCVQSIIDAQGLDAAPIRVLDTVDPVTVRDSFAWAKTVDAMLMVVSKSGKTVEIAALLNAWLADTSSSGASRSSGVGASKTADPGPASIVVVSDPDSTPLDSVLASAGAKTLRLSMPASVGGRYSMFTAVVQAPLAAAGLDPLVLCQAARRSWDSLVAAVPESSALVGQRAAASQARSSLIDALLWRAAHPAPNSVLWSYSDTWLPLAAWIQQLDCESLGRTRPGQSPVGDMMTPLRGPADQHSVAQLLLEGPRNARVCFLDRAPLPVDEALPGLARLREIERRATADALAGQGVPTSSLVIPATLDGLAMACLRSMIETVAWAALDDIDPYGQPAVELIKARIRAAGVL